MSENTKFFPLKSLAEEDRPREKMLLKGRQHLSNAELIAILIGSGGRRETAVGLSQRILSEYQNDLERLGTLNVGDLRRFRGIGTAKALTIIAALELGRRRQTWEPGKRSQLRCSNDIFRIVMPLLSDLPHEEFWVIYLNKANRVIEKEKISSGGIAGTVVDVKIIMKNALQHLSSAIAVSHNHPSGNLQPSDADIALTRKIKEAARLFDILLLDHIIVGGKNYYSFSDEGML